MSHEIDRQESFADLFEGRHAVKEGEVVHGTVLSIDNDYVQVDVGFKSEGLVPAWEFMDEDGTLRVRVGDRVDVLVEETEDEDGRNVLSKEKADRLKIWDEISRAYEADEPVEGVVPDYGAAGQVYVGQGFCELESVGGLSDHPTLRERWTVRDCPDLETARQIMTELR